MDAINGENYTRVSLDFRLLSLGAYAAEPRLGTRLGNRSGPIATRSAAPRRRRLLPRAAARRRGHTHSSDGCLRAPDPPDDRGAERVVVETYLRSDGFLTEHEKTRELEGALVRALPGVSDVVMTTSGSTALELALQALDVDSTTEVIVPDLTMVATANAARRLGARVVFADVDPETWTLTLDRVAPLLTERTRCVVWVALSNRGSARTRGSRRRSRRAAFCSLTLRRRSARRWRGSVASYGDLATLSSLPEDHHHGPGRRGRRPRCLGAPHRGAAAPEELRSQRQRAGAYVDGARRLQVHGPAGGRWPRQLADLPRRVARMVRCGPATRGSSRRWRPALARLRGRADAGWVPWFVDLELWVRARPGPGAPAFLHAHRVARAPCTRSSARGRPSPSGRPARPRSRTRGAARMPSFSRRRGYDGGVVDLVSELILIFYQRRDRKVSAAGIAVSEYQSSGLGQHPPPGQRQPRARSR